MNWQVRMVTCVAVSALTAAVGCARSEFRTADADVPAANDLGADAMDATAADASVDSAPDAPPDAATMDADASAPDADADVTSLDEDAGGGDVLTDPREEDASVPPDDGTLDADASPDAACPEGRVPVLGRCIVPSGVGFALGGAHACARGTAGLCGGAYCWGQNSFCAVGNRDDIDAGVRGCGEDGGIDPRTVNCASFPPEPPRRVTLPGEVLQFAGGNTHMCALVDDSTLHGSVFCWGRNTEGQIGDCSSTDRPAPVRVMLPRRAIQVAAGVGHTCALLEGGEPWCWGLNNYGQAGRVGSVSSPSPLAPPLDMPAVQIAVGGDTSCALIGSDGSVVCWGSNRQGQFGRPGTVVEGGPNRLPASGVSDAVQVAVGYQSVCALRQDGTVLCWGGNESCELGSSVSTTPIRMAQLVPGLTGVRQIAAHYAHQCAVVGPERSVWCWGLATSNQTGPGAATTNCILDRDAGTYVHARPTQFTELPAGGAAAVAVGGYHTCVLTRTGTLYCWGGNEHAELGSGTRGSSTALPVRVTVCPPGGVVDGGADASTG